jgi:transitional endoplasmic reticulum ATPase
MIEEGARKEILQDDYEKHRALADKLREQGQYDRAAGHYRKSAGLLVDLAEMEQSDQLASKRKKLAMNLRDAADSLEGGAPASNDDASSPGGTARESTGQRGAESPVDPGAGEQRHEADADLDAEEFLEDPPDLTFDDVGGMSELKQTLIDKVVDPLERTELYEAYDLGVVNAVLLYGPPGTGKTYISRALAGKLDYNFIEARPSDVTSSLVGEAADNVRRLFEVARENQPCLVFVDEVEALAPERAGGAQKTQSERQMITQILTELSETKGEDVIVVGATNLPDEIDGAALSRFQEQIEVPPPDAEARVAILRVHLRDRPVLTEELDWERVKELTAGYSARDLEVVAAEAARRALADAKEGPADVEPITQQHLAAAIEETGSSLEDWGG